MPTDDNNSTLVLDALDRQSALLSDLEEQIVLLSDSVSDSDAVSNSDFQAGVTAILDTLSEEPEVDPDAVSNEQIFDSLIQIQDSISLLSADVYDGNISSTVLDYFDRISYKFGVLDDYLVYRSSNYGYTLVWGDLDLQGRIFSGSACRFVSIDTASISGRGYRFNSGVMDVDVDVNENVVYSNLGDYPALKRADSPSSDCLLVLALIVAVCSVVRPWANWVLRRGSVRA